MTTTMSIAFTPRSGKLSLDRAGARKGYETTREQKKAADPPDLRDILGNRFEFSARHVWKDSGYVALAWSIAVGPRNGYHSLTDTG